MSQMTDSRGFRTGAAISVALLSLVALLDGAGASRGASSLLVAAIAAAMLLSAATALRVSLLALPFRRLRQRRCRQPRTSRRRRRRPILWHWRPRPRSRRPRR